MKKLLVLLTLMVGVLGFSAGAFGQPCYSCKGAVRDVPCGVVQGGPCAEFDYDTPFGPATGVGYCVAASMLAPNNYRAIFDVCDCADPTFFSIPGNVVGVRMTILVDNVAGDLGAYWSDDAGAAPIGLAMDPTSINKAAACGLGAYAGTFGGETYFESDGTTASIPWTSAGGCAVPAANHTTVLSSRPVGPGYLVVGGEQAWWWVDIPPVRIDPNVLNSGETVSVKVELIDQNSICATCSLCECVIPVAQVCCGAAAVAPQTFPYFTSLTAGSWWNGIALVNTGATANSVTLTAFVQDGTTDTVTVSVPANSMFVDLLENITWAGTGTGGLPLYIIATPTIAGLDGFAMIANGTESMGYLPRR